MSQTSSSKVHCYHYDRNDWLKVDVNALLAPWTNRVSEVYLIGKTPAKYIVTYALWRIAGPHTQEILDVVDAIFGDPGTFQRRYGTQLGSKPPNTDILTNSNGLRPANPRQVNFMDLVDYWAVPINRSFGIGIIQCRDVVKIALTFFLADHAFPLAKAIQGLVHGPDQELFSEGGKVIFPGLEVVVSELG